VLRGRCLYLPVFAAHYVEVVHAAPAAAAGPSVPASNAKDLQKKHSDLEREAERKQTLIQKAVESRQAMLEQQAARLAQIQAEAEGASQLEKADIDALRVQMEAAARKAGGLYRIAADKKIVLDRAAAEYATAKEAADVAESEKAGLQKRLLEMIVAASTSKQERLDKLLKDLNS